MFLSLALQVAARPEWVDTAIAIASLLLGYPVVATTVVSTWRRVGGPNPRVMAYIAGFGIAAAAVLLGADLPSFDAANPGLLATEIAAIGVLIAKMAQAEYDYIWSRFSFFNPSR